MNQVNDGAQAIPIGRGRDCEIHSGYRVIGNNTSNGDLTVWYSGTLEDAMRMAARLAEENGGQQVDVVKYVCSVRPAIQVEVVKAVDAADDAVDKVAEILKSRPV